MLYLIGVGLTKGSISIRALEACKKCDVYYDNYTSVIADDYLDYLQHQTGRKIAPLGRKSLEEGIKFIIDKSKNNDVAVLVAGDPLVATTHKIIFISAKEAGVQVKVIHAESVLATIMGESGLDFYRFGQICTIPRWEKNYKPISFYETIMKNQRHDQHSIVLFDYDPEKKSSLPLEDALAELQEAEKEYIGGIGADTARIFVMHNLSAEDQEKHFMTIKDAKALKLGPGPTAIIIPARLSEVETEVIESMY